MKNPVVRTSQLMGCTVAQAFDAFVDPKQITRFWLASTSGPLAEHAQVTWNFLVPGATEQVTVTDFQPARLLSFNWSDGGRVRLEFSEHASGKTLVAVEAQGFSGEDVVDQVVNATEGFTIVLCDLKTLLESGQSANLVRDKAQLIASSQDSK